MIIGMTKIADVVPTEVEVAEYARLAYEAFAGHQQRMKQIVEPRWFSLRHDLRSFWIGQARATLSVYAFNSNPVESE